MTDAVKPLTAQAVIAGMPETLAKLREVERLAREAFGEVVHEERRVNRYVGPGPHQDAIHQLHALIAGAEKLIYPVAMQDWHIEARVRILEDRDSGSVDPHMVRRFRAGEELRMIQWGRSGVLVKHDSWWTSYDIDGAHIIDADKVEVLEVLDEISPFE